MDLSWGGLPDRALVELAHLMCPAADVGRYGGMLLLVVTTSKVRRAQRERGRWRTNEGGRGCARLGLLAASQVSQAAPNQESVCAI